MASWGGLFELVTSLTPAERRLFVKQIGGGGQEPTTKLVRMFSLICQQTTWDEDLLARQLASEGYLVTYISADKRYLYESLLAFIREGSTGKSPAQQIKKMLIEGETLFARGLLQEGLKRIRQARKLANQTENFLLNLEGLNLQARMVEETEGPGAALSLERERKTLQKTHKEHQKTERLYRKLLQLLRESPRLRDPRVRDLAHQVMAHPLTHPDAKFRSRKARVQWHRIHAAWSFMNNQVEPELRHATDALRLLIHDSRLYQDLPEITARQIARVFSICKYAPEPFFKSMLDAFWGHSAENRIQNRHVSAFIFGQAQSIALSRYVALNHFQSALDALPGILETLNRFERIMHRSSRMALCYGIAVLEFARGNHRQALIWVNRILNEFSIKDRPDLYHFAQIFSLIIHFDLGNIPLLEYRVRAVRAAFRKRESLFETEKHLLAFFEACTRAVSEQEFPALLTKLQVNLSQALDNPFERNAHNYFDFFRWAEARKEGRTFLSVDPGLTWNHYQEKMPEGAEKALAGLGWGTGPK